MIKFAIVPTFAVLAGGILAGHCYAATEEGTAQIAAVNTDVQVIPFAFSAPTAIDGLDVEWALDEGAVLPLEWRVETQQADGTWKAVSGAYPILAGRISSAVFADAVTAQNWRMVIDVPAGKTARLISRKFTCDKVFARIFNGVDNSGWIGATNRYIVAKAKPGVLQCFPNRPDKCSNLLYNKVLKNFVFRFEFMMPENGNNGVGIRTPNAFVDAAYHGMCELQLLDDGGSAYYDKANKKDKLAKYQYTGSVYGVVPSRRDNPAPETSNYTGGGSYVMKPGYWNYEEVRVVGSEIEVYLNGVLITKADVGPMNVPSHPGLHNAEGYIGFLGHGDNVKWRNITLRELPENMKMDDLKDFATMHAPADFNQFAGNDMGVMITTSACFPRDTPAAILDGIVPKSSGDNEVPRYTWWAIENYGKEQWIRFDMPEPTNLKGIDVYWYDDKGGCSLPEKWHIEYLKDDGTWAPIEGSYEVKDDVFSQSRFTRHTRANSFRIVVKSRPGSCGGILEAKFVH